MFRTMVSIINISPNKKKLFCFLSSSNHFFFYSHRNAGKKSDSKTNKKRRQQIKYKKMYAKNNDTMLLEDLPDTVDIEENKLNVKGFFWMQSLFFFPFVFLCLCSREDVNLLLWCIFRDIFMSSFHKTNMREQSCRMQQDRSLCLCNTFEARRREKLAEVTVEQDKQRTRHSECINS